MANQFDRFASFHAEGAAAGSAEGEEEAWSAAPSVFSVDIDTAACAASRRFVSNRTRVTAGDSVAFLWNFPPPPSLACSTCSAAAQPRRHADLLYLDSFDVRLHANVQKCKESIVLQ